MVFSKKSILIKGKVHSELLELAKQNEKECIYKMLIEKQQLDEVSSMLGVVKEYEIYEERFDDLILSNTEKALELQTDFQFFLLEKICLPDENI